MSYGQQILWHPVIIKISQLFLEKIATIMECTNKKSNLNCRIHFKRKSDLNVFHKKPAGHYIYQAEPFTNIPVLFWVCAACVLIDLNTVAKQTVFQSPILFEWLIMQQNNSHAHPELHVGTAYGCKLPARASLDFLKSFKILFHSSWSNSTRIV